MKSKKILVLNILFFSSFIFAQETQQKKFKVDAGFEFRIVPFNFKNEEGLYTTNKFFLYNRDKHLSGNSINVSIEYYFLKNTTIGINQSFRYDQLYSDNNLDNPNNYFTTDQHMRIIADTEIQLKQYFPLKNINHQIIGSLGYGFMNNNTLFHVTEVYDRDPNGQINFSRTSEVDFQFQAYKIGVGYKYKKFEAMIGTYIVEKDNFDDYSSGFGMPFLRLTYNIVKF
jgi:hypothetical protein